MDDRATFGRSEHLQDEQGSATTTCPDCDHVHLDDDGPRCGTVTEGGLCRCTKAPEWAR